MNEKKYYNEPIEKDTAYRKEYVKGIEDFLNERKSATEAFRQDFISPEKYKKNPEFYREKFVELLGFPLKEKREISLLEKTFVVQDGNVNIYRMQFLFLGQLKFYGMYFEQLEGKKEKPFVFGFHGGGGTPELVSSMHLDSSNYNHLVRRMTDKGANVFAPQFLLWRDDLYGKGLDRVHTDGKLRQLGGCITALELYFMQGILDYFLEQENINANKIGVAGLSYGGMYALHFAAIDTRIKACYSCSWVNDLFVHSWADWSYFNAQKYFTTAETMALVCPRALVVAMGDKDELFDYRLTISECEKVKAYYEEMSCEKKFEYYIFDGTHETDKNDVEIEYLLYALS